MGNNVLLYFFGGHQWHGITKLVSPVVSSCIALFKKTHYDEDRHCHVNIHVHGRKGEGGWNKEFLIVIRGSLSESCTLAKNKSLIAHKWLKLQTTCTHKAARN
jgi:hypothetical protein